MKRGVADVLVLGLGPAGASAAAAAARAGLRVVALDRKKIPGQPVQCAELVPAPVAQDCAAVASARCQRVSGMRSFVEREGADHHEQFPGDMLDRATFDARLVEEARAAGAECRFGASVTAVAPDGAVLVHAARLTAPVVIGADGPHSALGRMLGMRNRSLVWARQAVVDLPQCQDTTDIFLSARFVGGYGWLFPKGARANVGVGVDGRARAGLATLLTGLLGRLAEAGRIAGRPLAFGGGAIPVGGPLPARVSRGGRLFLLAGDAAGLTNPVTGAGIHAALLSGRLAGKAAADHLGGDPRAADDYAEELHDVFHASLRRALARRAQLWNADRAPDCRALRAGWIAYPEYWTNDLALIAAGGAP